jgi:hypothetical protein
LERGIAAAGLLQPGIKLRRLYGLRLIEELSDLREVGRSVAGNGRSAALTE